MSQVTLRVTREATGESRAAVTDTDGQFAVATLPPGAYRIEIEQAGYKKYVFAHRAADQSGALASVSLELGDVERRGPGDSAAGAARDRVGGARHGHRRPTGGWSSARRPELSGAVTARARRSARAAGVGQFAARRLRLHGERRPRGCAEFPARRRCTTWTRSSTLRACGLRSTPSASSKYSPATTMPRSAATPAGR